METEQDIITYSTLRLGLHCNNSQLSTNANKKQCIMLTSQNEVCIIGYQRYELNIIWKLRL